MENGETASLLVCCCVVVVLDWEEGKEKISEEKASGKMNSILCVSWEEREIIVTSNLYGPFTFLFGSHWKYPRAPVKYAFTTALAILLLLEEY